MKTYKKVKKAIDVVTSAQCNKCGDVIYDADPCVSRCLEVDYYFGYGTKYDSKRVEFDLCDCCLVKITKRFKIPPTWSSWSY